MTRPTRPRVGAAWRQLRDQLADIGIETASLDARLLAQQAFGWDAVQLAMRENDPAPVKGLPRLAAFGQRRLAGEPVARILGEKEFYGLSFALSPDTLVPRPETELVVDLAHNGLKDIKAPRFIDLGTGTGCIAIALLKKLPRAEAIVTDLSAGALDTARGNAERHGVAARIDFRQGDWFAPIAADETVDIIVSNPPYIAHAAIATLDTEVRDSDPHLALDGGSDGLDPYRVLARDSGRHLTPNGAIVLEHGTGQSSVLASLFRRHGFVNTVRHDDLSGHDRVLFAVWPD